MMLRILTLVCVLCFSVSGLALTLAERAQSCKKDLADVVVKFKSELDKLDSSIGEDEAGKFKVHKSIEIAKSNLDKMQSKMSERLASVSSDGRLTQYDVFIIASLARIELGNEGRLKATQTNKNLVSIKDRVAASYVSIKAILAEHAAIRH